jgi:hypothetical protein
MHAQASLLVGGPGTAKTSIINQFLGRFPAEEFTAKTITFSSLTTPAIFRLAVEVGPAYIPGSFLSSAFRYALTCSSMQMILWEQCCG